MSEQSIKSSPQAAANDDILEKEYHEIGIHAVQAATCIKKQTTEKKHVDYDSVIETD